MKKVRITAIRQTVYTDLMKKYENPIQHACNIQEGQQWISVNATHPDGLCPSAWDSMHEFVKSLAQGKGNFFDGWMQNPMSAMISCNDGFRPFSFYLEAIEEDKTQTTKETQQIATYTPKNKTEERIMKLVRVIGHETRPRKQIIAYLGMKQKSRKCFIYNYLQPAIDAGYIIMAYPNSPNKPEQAYKLTANGVEFYEKININT